MVAVAGRTCFKSMYTVEFAAKVVAACKGIELRASVKVAAVPELLHTLILDTTVVVAEGTVYKSVAVFVVAVPLKRSLVAVAISYYLSD
jgi:hypothetical protein